MENISKYLEDKKFIEWVFNPDETLDNWWSSFKIDNPHEKENIILAKNIINSLRTNDKELSENEKILLFSQILKQVEDNQQSARKVRIFGTLLKYAAVALVFFLIGALLFYKQDNFSPQFYTQQLAEPDASETARLIRPGAEDIQLEEQKSFIEYRDDGSVMVNNTVAGSNQHHPQKAPEMNQLVIPYGKTSEIILPDGTKAFLNAGSRLVYPEFFVDKTREVFLVGEAFFDVTHDENNPFIVQTTDVRIKVLGTSFNVSAYPSDKIIETVLTKGKVMLEQNSTRLFDESIEMVPGQLAAFDKTKREAILNKVDIENYTLWKDGLLKFESSDLSRVIKKLERFYNIRFSYQDPFLGGIEISGKLDLNENRDEVLGVVASAASVRILKTGEDFYKIKK
ncbi:FecR family protein [Tangfeifania diversioriginum]|uniref:FecR family protein n=1 Tax=Tangfeifania diversioriginum TaxID=1168035 RepID=A0A1M6M9Q0_9BACT|nr:FecR domain-containing protein [Tangfeifania diversioriginum]SHJ80144.1 FecR family protein [Tangfeifania diversioriginum]